MARHIMIVDDDEDDCDLFCDAAQMVDSEVVCEKTYSTKSALRLLSTVYKPDFIFLDLNMPMFDGVDCLIEMRKIKSLDEVPIIIYTTSNRKDDQEKTQRLGANYFITKPNSLRELRCEIANIILHRWESSPHLDS